MRNFELTDRNMSQSHHGVDMATAASVFQALNDIGSKLQPEMSERDVENLFIETGFYTSLGYEGTGVDIRSEYTLPDDRRPDFITLNNYHDVIAVYEFKTSGRDLAEHESQLFHYINELKSDYGVLTNGSELRIYRRGENRPIETFSVLSITEQQAQNLASNLKKRELDLSKSEDVRRFREELDPIPLNEQAELGQENFFDTFRLEEGSPFADLVTAMMDLLRELRDEQQADFVIGAYDFWSATYADEPEEIPSSWDSFVESKQSLRDFMFCLESGHALLSRLLLAKATEDHGFFEGTGYNGVDDYFRELRGFGEDINLNAFPVAASNLIDDMRDRLIEGLFSDDIFVWWTDGYTEQLSRRHESRQNQFRDVAEGTGSIDRVSEQTQDRMSRAVAEVFANILRFDFTDVQGDLLGDLYQRYFSPETRKALGEFYTPQPVVDYIMDGVGYDRGVSNKRLIDPACGSGTFLVEAVKRYLDDVERYAVGEPDWEQQLRELCTQPHIVGLDIHPFAVLMAQIRFVAAILPAYRKAKEQNPEFTLRRLPIYRTDTLRDERKLTGVDLGADGSRQITLVGVTENEQDVLIPVPLPLEVDEQEATETEGGFLVRRVRMPLFDTIKLETGVQSFGEYFAAIQGVLDTVKDHMRFAEEFGVDFDWTYRSGLEQRVNYYTSQQYSGIEDFFEPYVDDMLENVRYLQERHNDGRLFKMFEDTVLALVVKNYMKYDYVLGNPPYVRKESIPSDYKQNILKPLYPEVYTGNADLSVYFAQRGIELLREGGKISYITSIKFTKSTYGEGIRKSILCDTQIKEFSNFEMSNFFEDATAYPCVFVLKKGATSVDYDISVIYAKNKPDDVNSAVQFMRDAMRNPDTVRADYFERYITRKSDLDEREWRFVPKEANDIFRKVDNLKDTVLSEVMEDISAGIKTGMNSVFILEENETHKIEDELLKPILRGNEIKKYDIGIPDEYVIYTSDIQIDNFPRAKSYLSQYKGKLANRKDGAFKGKKWFELNIPLSTEVLGSNKIICPDISEKNNFAYDTEATYILNTAYLLRPTGKSDYSLNYLTGLLNSNVLEFYVKMISPPLRGGYHRYITKYLEPLPVKSDDGSMSKVEQQVNKIRDIKRIEEKASKFPKSYIKRYDGEVDYITYEWQTRRFPINATVQGNVDEDFTVQAGRTDNISDPAMYSDNHEGRKKRAEYVCTAVNGRNAKDGEEMTIPIPQSDDGVEELIKRLEEDKRKVEQTDIDELEAEIDELVYDLFELTDDEREVIEDYLEVF
jgi:type I restriction-modification system DNA methylase subunit